MFSLQMNRERRRYRKLARGVSLAVSKAVSLSSKNLKKESIKSLIKMGTISNNWNILKRRIKKRSGSTSSVASGLSELDRRLEDFSQESPIHDRSFSENGVNSQTEFDMHLHNDFYDFNQWKYPEEASKYRGVRNYFSPYRPLWNVSPPNMSFDRSKYVWRKADSVYSKPKLSEPVEDIPATKSKTPFKDDCADEVLEKVYDNRSEILSLGWQWLKMTVAILSHIFNSSATVIEIEEYRNKCYELEERILFFIGSSNFQSDYVPWSAKTFEGMPMEEIIMFVLLIHFALIEHDEIAFRFIVGGIIGTMVYLFITFKSQYPKQDYINFVLAAKRYDGGGDGMDAWAVGRPMTTRALVAVAEMPLALRVYNDSAL